MKLLNRSKSGGDNPGPFMFVLAAILMPFVEGKRKLAEKVYSGWKGAFRRVLGVFLGIGAAIGTSNYLGWQLDWSWYAWVPVGLAAHLATYWYVWPLLYLFPINPVWKLVDAIYDVVQKFMKEHFESLTLGVLKVIRTICVGSNKLWSPVIADQTKAIFSLALVAIAYLSSFAGSAYLGWNTYELIIGLLPVAWTIVSIVLAVAGGLLVFGVLFGLLFQMLQYGKLPIVGITTGGAAVWALSSDLVGIATGLGASGYFVYAAHAVAFLAYVGYAFPLVNLLLSNGLWKRLYELVKPLVEKTYDEENRDYRKLFHHVINLAAMAGFGFGAYLVAGSIGLPLAAVVAVTALVAVCSYVGFFELIDHSAGNALLGGASAVAAAITVGNVYADAGLLFGTTGAIVTGVTTFLVVGFVLFPLAYLTLRAIISGASASLGGGLDSLYTGVRKQFKKLVDKFETVYENTYKDKAPYQELFLHVTNIAVAYAAFLGASFLTAGMGAIGSTVVIALAVYVTYCVFGKLLFKSGYGTEFVGAVTGLAVAVYVGTQAYSLGNPGLAMQAVCVLVGLVTWVLAFALLFPAAYLVSKYTVGFVLTPLLRGLLVKVYAFLWSGFDWFWRGVASALKVVNEFFKPLWASIGRAMKRLSDAYGKVLDRIRGRK